MPPGVVRGYRYLVFRVEFLLEPVRMAADTNCDGVVQDPIQDRGRWHARDVESKMYRLVFLETRRRVGDSCRLTEWQGGAGTLGWIAGFEDLSVRWDRGSAAITMTKLASETQANQEVWVVKL